jgi:hypothetical protein
LPLNIPHDITIDHLIELRDTASGAVQVAQQQLTETVRDMEILEEKISLMKRLFFDPIKT